MRPSSAGQSPSAVLHYITCIMRGGGGGKGEVVEGKWKRSKGEGLGGGGGGASGRHSASAIPLWATNLI